MTKNEKYIPVLNQNWLTPLYDPVLKWGMREETFKRYLIENAIWNQVKKCWIWDVEQAH